MRDPHTDILSRSRPATLRSWSKYSSQYARERVVSPGWIMHWNVGYVGLALVLVGATLLASPTLGFETIAADRTTNVSTTEDPSALLGVVDNSGSANSEIKHNNPGVVYYLNDNAGEFPDAADIQADVVSFDGGSTGLVASVQPSTSADDYEVVVECGTAGFNGDGTVTVAIEATGPVTVDVERTTTQQVSVKCKGGGNSGGNGPASFTASDVTYDGSEWVQQFEFDLGALKNKNQATIDLSDAQANSGVDYSDATATITSGHDSRSFGFDSNSFEVSYEASGNPSGTLVVEMRGLQLESDQDGTASYSDDAGRTDSDTFGVPALATGSGETTTDGDAIVTDRSSANDDITAGEDVIVGDSAQTNGDVEAGGDVTYGDGSAANGELDAGGDVTFGSGSSAGDEVEAGGDVTFGSGSTANDDVSAGGSIEIGTDGTADGDLDAGGNVEIGSGATANGEIDADGSVTIGSDATANDDVTATGDVYLEDGATVHGDIDTDGTVYVGCDVTMNGEVDADGGTESTC